MMYTREQLFSFNDYELLYLIASKHEEAINIMYQKYSYLIFGRMKKFRIYEGLKDDFYQEGLIVLHQAIKRFNPMSKCSFTNFFDLLLQRRFITLVKQYTKKYSFDELSDVTKDELIEEISENKYKGILDNVNIEDLSLLERKIYQYRYIDGIKAKEISTRIGIEPKKVYNTLARIKDKIKKGYSDKYIK
jgi:RNA polymerase sporulation-specific sigma factor